MSRVQPISPTESKLGLHAECPEPPTADEAEQEVAPAEDLAKYVPDTQGALRETGTKATPARSSIRAFGTDSRSTANQQVLVMELHVARTTPWESPAMSTSTTCSLTQSGPEDEHEPVVHANAGPEAENDRGDSGKPLKE